MSVEKHNTAESQPKHEQSPPPAAADKPEEFGGPAGLEPTRYGDWEKKGRCIDF